MSDHSISIVPRQSVYPARELKAQEIIEWLTSLDIIKPAPSNCTLGSFNGYSISDGARLVTNYPDNLPFDLIVNGLEIVTKRQIFGTGENGMKKLICPNCRQDISSEGWTFFNEWNDHKSNDITCPLCSNATEIHKFDFTPQWGFSDLGFTFWNWPALKEAFIDKFKQKLNCDINVVISRI